LVSSVTQQAAAAVRASGRGLTPGAHARIRRHLVLIPAYLWLVYSWRDILWHLPLGLPGSRMQAARDFIQFYLQGVIANEGHAHALYDIDYWQTIYPRLAAGLPPLRYPPVYGPQISVLFSPLAHLPYITALCVWIFLTLAIYLACGYAVARVCTRLRAIPATVALLLLADPALHYALSFAQISALGLLCVTAAFLALRANRPFVAGIAIGSLVYKPQLGFAAAVIFVFAREWRIVLGALAGAALQLAAGCLFWGPAILRDYVASLVRLAPVYAEQFEPFKYHLHSWRGFFDVLGVPGGVATAGYVIASAMTLALAVRCWRARGPLGIRYSVLLLATVLVNPHLYVYDLVLLAPAYLLLWEWALEHETRTVGEVLPTLPLPWLRRRSFGLYQWLLYFCYMSPLFAIVAIVARIQFSVPALTLLGLVPAFLLWKSAEAGRRAVDA
jgi:hypothetical protein